MGRPSKTLRRRILSLNVRGRNSLGYSPWDARCSLIPEIRSRTIRGTYLRAIALSMLGYPIPWTLGNHSSRRCWRWRLLLVSGRIHAAHTQNSRDDWLSVRAGLKVGVPRELARG